MVKRVDCGFLAERVMESRGFGAAAVNPKTPIHQPEYLEVPIEVRRAGFPRTLGWFECFAAEHDLGNEREDEKIGWDEVVNRVRECDQFTPYVMGHTPKEHAAFQRQEAQEERAEARHQEALKVARDSHFRELKWIGGGVTAALLLGGVFGAMIEAQWFAKWFWLNKLSWPF